MDIGATEQELKQARSSGGRKELQLKAAEEEGRQEMKQLISERETLAKRVSLVESRIQELAGTGIYGDPELKQAQWQAQTSLGRD